MAKWWLGAIVACIVLLSTAVLMPRATAGSADDPEIADPEGDAALSPGVPALLPVPQMRAVDVLAAWVTLEGEVLGFHVRVADLDGIETVGNDPLADFRWSLRFELPHADLPREEYWRYTWNAHPNFSGLVFGGGWEYMLWDPRIEEYVDVTGTTDLESDTITTLVPLAMLENASAGHQLVSLSSDAGHYWPEYPVWIGDWSDEGRDFTIPGAAAEPGDDVTVTTLETEDSPLAALPWILLALLGISMRRRR